MDTNIFRGLNFKFKSRFFQNVLNDLRKHDIKFLTTDIHKQEVEKKINDWIEENHLTNKIVRSNKILNETEEQVDGWNDIELKLEKNKKELIEHYKKSFHDLLNDLSARTLYVDDVRPASVFKSFFEIAPPFSTNKRNEFRDAFILYAIADFAINEKEIVHIISTDADFRNFFEENSNIKLHSSLDNWNDFLNRRERYYEQIMQTFQGDMVQINIIEYVSEHDFIGLRNYVEKEIVEGNVKNISLDKTKVPKGAEINLVKIEEFSDVLHAEISIEVKMNFSYDIETPDKFSLINAFKYDSEEIKRNGIMLDGVLEQVLIFPVHYSLEFRITTDENLELSSVKLTNFDNIYVNKTNMPITSLDLIENFKLIKKMNFKL
ncbi:PIN domain-containing protein [Marinococcus sp. PL1-022]|uniref:PIN domain-containing protein n=1 Tax=Marinococcus sp. PL1-022 TaxID=3095363 RepID=UPI0029C44548|nr:PIN domain-containing protein [Marinococcus sp. PL1-022]MDX6154488.1 PIN domain-containing protein [Marinococcus sp. PL1-022]